MPLAFLGMYLGMSRGRDLSLLYTFTFGYMVSLLLAVINARYRMPVFPFLSLFAAYAIVFVKDSVKGNFSKIVVCSTILLVAIVLCHIPVERVSLETSHNSLGVLLKRDGKIDEAIGEYNEALKIAPGYPSPYYNLGILYRDTGQPAEAIKYFKKAVELDPAGATPAREKLEELLK